MAQTHTEVKFKAGIELPKLPYEENALEPIISARTISFHYGKHHAGYVNTLKKLIEGTSYAERPLEEIITSSAKDSKATSIFNNAGQVWNHTFYWNSMRPRGGGEPSSKLKSAIESSFGSFEDFREQFSKVAIGQFGSGWAWVIADKGGKLKIISTSNADTPVAHGQLPLLTIDVWEHAYYLDYQNQRAAYVEAWLDKLVNWDFAEWNYG